MQNGAGISVVEVGKRRRVEKGWEEGKGMEKTREKRDEKENGNAPTVVFERWLDESVHAEVGGQS